MEVSRPSRIATIARLLIGVVFVTVVLIAVPESRWILLAVLVFSVPIGIVVAFVLRWWHRRKPLEAEKVSNKRPLGLDG